VVEHREELDGDRSRESQDEHEADGIDLNVFSGVLEVDVELGHPYGEGGVEELQGERRHQPDAIRDEEGKVDLCVKEKDEFSVNCPVVSHCGRCIPCSSALAAHW